MKLEYSAGGVVVRDRDGQKEILLAQHAAHHGWVFPKGHIGDTIKGETKEETAVREVEEETGVLATIEAPLRPIMYQYTMDGIRREKTVYYFLMTFVSEDFSKKDAEMENVTWLPLADVEKKLTYPSDKSVWEEAREIIEGKEMQK